MTSTYSTIDEMLLGSVPPPLATVRQKFVDDAANEIDSMIGFIYKTPINMSEAEDNTVVRPARLLIRRVANHLATGRLIMAVAASSEDESTHAYANRLIRDALNVLNQIARGDLKLDGAELLPDESGRVTGPQITNLDPHSHVEDFYDRLAKPGYGFQRFPMTP